MKHGMMINGRYVPTWKFEHRRGQEHFGVAEREYRAAIGLVDAIVAKTGEIARDRNLSDVGRKAAFQNFVSGAVAPIIKNARAASKAARDRGSQRHGELLPARRGKDDLAGAILAGEIRAHLRAMDPAKRNARIAVGAFSADELQAIAEMPAEYSGVSEEQRAKVLGQAVLAANPEAAKEISDLGEAADAVDLAVRAVTLEIEKAGVKRSELAEVLGEPVETILGRLREAERADDHDQSAA